MSSKIPPLMNRMRSLIATPSVSSVNADLNMGNRPVIDLLASWLEDLGMRVELVEVPSRPGDANLIATLGQGPGGLVLSGHTDTVPCDERLWNFDPFTGTEQDNRLYGLGSADMKSFIAMAIEAAGRFRADDLEHPLILLATADEESGMSGARALVQAGRPKARFAIIGEPTGLRPIRMHKGMMMEAIRLTGRSGHSSDPALGVNALEGMHRVLGEILVWRQELQARHHNPLFAVPGPTVNLGRIHGGDNPNRICGACELQIDLRPLPGMDMQALRDELGQRLRTVLVDSGLELEVASLFAGTPPFQTAEDSPIIQAAEKISGYSADSVAFGTEAPYLTQLGMDTAVMGPGHIEQAHQPDEYLPLDSVQPCVEMLTALIRRFCQDPDGRVSRATP
jgi:acetylornithine deacetylase